MEGYSVEEAARILGCAGHGEEPVRPRPGALAALLSHLKAEEGS
jgi:hypothetical protein